VAIRINIWIRDKTEPWIVLPLPDETKSLPNMVPQPGEHMVEFLR